MTADDILSFHPKNLLRKQFILSPNIETLGIFEIIAYCKGKDKIIKYVI